MSYGDFYFLSVQKNDSYYYSQKRGRIPMCFDLFIYSAKLKFLLCSLVSCFFNTLIGSTLFHTLNS